MPWPIATLAVKFVSIKFIKGAIFGLGRYAYKVVSAKPRDEHGRSLEGIARLKHNMRNGVGDRENLIFLILMIGNIFFSLQELCLWCWGNIAKRRYPHFCSGMPAALTDPNLLSAELKDKPRRTVFSEIGRWFAIAGLFYWPMPEGNLIRLTPLKDKRWLEIAYKRHVYLVRIDKKRTFNYAGMCIQITASGSVTVLSECGQLKREYRCGTHVY